MRLITILALVCIQVKTSDPVVELSPSSCAAYSNQSLLAFVLKYRSSIIRKIIKNAPKKTTCYGPTIDQETTTFSKKELLQFIEQILTKEMNSIKHQQQQYAREQQILANSAKKGRKKRTLAFNNFH